MRKFICVFLVLSFLFIQTACDPSGDGSFSDVVSVISETGTSDAVSSIDGNASSADESSASNTASSSADASISEPSSTEASSSKTSGAFSGSTSGGNSSMIQSNPQSSSSSSSEVSNDTIVDFKRNGYDSSLLVGTDHFGRSFDTITSYKSNKQVGMFFWLWIGQPYASGIYDSTKILAMENGLDLLTDPASLNRSISPDGQAHFWGEPLWGYYNSADEWVIRKQIEMLTMADVDFIVFDTTNALTYKNVYIKILKVIDEYQREGFDPPKAAFYTHSRSMDTVRTLYRELYSANLYPNTWYMMNGKPMIIGYTDTALDKLEAQSRGDSSYSPAPYSQEILDFFYFKKPQWPSDMSFPDGFPWIEWTYPQPLHDDMLSVTVASHPQVPFSFSLTRGAVNWGRGWDPTKRLNISANVDKGTFFQLQWDTAHRLDPELVFVGGWNEWIAYKQMYLGEYMLCDAVDKEFSRDIEPMNGGYQDAFYLQLISNVRRFKGVDNGDISFAAKTIDHKDAISQWDSVKAVYRNVGQTGYARNEFAVTTKYKYIQAAPRNNIQSVKVSHDDNNVYFMIKCQNNITEYTSGENWMNVFIGTGDPALKAWENYDYVIGRSPSPGSGTSSIHKLKSDFSGQLLGQAEYTVHGDSIVYKIPRNQLGLSAINKAFYFKVTDGIEKPSDIMDTYVTGKALPMGRLSYKYVMQ